jgi:hypothetical protein
LKGNESMEHEARSSVTDDTAHKYPAITVWNPWASLIAAGAKPYEWRGWRPPGRFIGQRIAIHAGTRRVKRDEISELIYDCRSGRETSLVVALALPLLERWHTSPGSLPLSSVLCTAVLGEPINAPDYAASIGMDSNRVDHTKFGWPLTEIEVVEPFVPARGRQGFWYWSGPAPGGSLHGRSQHPEPGAALMAEGLCPGDA